jgi:HEAT repeat protein
MANETDQETIKRLIDSFAGQEPPLWMQGTPLLADTEATESLVRMGHTAVPALVNALDAQNPKIVMYAAFCLGLIGDRSALAALERTKGEYAAIEPKGQYGFGVISTVNRALDNLLAREQ